MNNLERALAYLDKLPPAVSGSGGHNATLRAACECVRFGLSDSEALAALLKFNERCTPPWKEAELRHKIASARQKARAGEKAAPRRGSSVRTFSPPAWTKPAPTVPVCQRSEEAEEAWWATVAAELGTTLAEFDARCGATHD